MKKIPALLLYSRPMAIGCLLYLTALETQPIYWMITIISFTLLADIFDGIIARKLNVSTTQLRVLDTIFDLAFYIAVLYCVYRVNATSVIQNRYLLAAILALEILLYSVSLLRFAKVPSPHAFLSKCWGLWLAVELILLLLRVPGDHFSFALKFGILVHLERLLIYLLLPKWDHDIPSVYHAWLIRQGRPIQRHKLLNG